MCLGQFEGRSELRLTNLCKSLKGNQGGSSRGPVEGPLNFNARTDWFRMRRVGGWAGGWSVVPENN